MNEYLNTQQRVLTSRSLASKVVLELERLPGQAGSSAAQAQRSLQADPAAATRRTLTPKPRWPGPFRVSWAAWG